MQTLACLNDQGTLLRDQETAWVRHGQSPPLGAVFPHSKTIQSSVPIQKRFAQALKGRTRRKRQLKWPEARKSQNKIIIINYIYIQISPYVYIN